MQLVNSIREDEVRGGANRTPASQMKEIASPLNFYNMVKYGEFKKSGQKNFDTHVLRSTLCNILGSPSTAREA